jgi:hypothetical protein
MLPEGSKKKKEEDPTSKKGNHHSLVANNSSSDSWIMLALKVTLRLREDEPSTHQSFWGMLVLYEWRSMEKTQYMNDIQHIIRQEMHREVRATTNFSQ